jgi:hypothetical protein
MRCLVVWQDEGYTVLCSLTNKTHKLILETEKSPELEYIYPFFPPTPPFCFPLVLYTPTAS